MLKCQQCGKPFRALIYDLCGYCLRDRVRARRQIERGEEHARYVMAGSDIPLREMFGERDLHRLMFQRWLVEHEKLVPGG